ncbi:unnamed protein product [Owenia fusiformis]|uniref:Uncharacterized protein n=1 Tax=Owenia fusiformis TaxID=6347 RepID=A0A8J1UXQ7_OWEFU|nr:unnamed protein product [Owenia fusiformis]
MKMLRKNRNYLILFIGFVIMAAVTLGVFDNSISRDFRKVVITHKIEGLLRKNVKLHHEAGEFHASTTDVQNVDHILGSEIYETILDNNKMVQPNVKPNKEVESAQDVQPNLEVQSNMDVQSSKNIQPSMEVQPNVQPNMELHPNMQQTVDIQPNTKIQPNIDIYPNIQQNTQVQPFSVYPNANQNLLIYNRFPKSGSTTMNYFLSQRNGSNFIFIHSNTYQRRLHSTQEILDFIQSFQNLTTTKKYLFDRHLHFVNFENFGYKQPIYLNLLREPLEQILSKYYYRYYRLLNPDYAKDYGADRLAEFYREHKNQTFEECIRDIAFNKKSTINENINSLIGENSDLDGNAIDKNSILDDKNGINKYNSVSFNDVSTMDDNRTINDSGANNDSSAIVNDNGAINYKDPINVGLQKQCFFHKGQKYVEWFCGHDDSCSNMEYGVPQAKHNIDKYYMLVGLTDEYSRTLNAMEQLLPSYFEGMGKINTRVKMNSVPSKYKKRPTSQEVIDFVKRRLKYEYEIYNFVKQKFYKTLQKLNIK